MKHGFSEKVKLPDCNGIIEKLKRIYHRGLVQDKKNKAKHEDPKVRKKGYVDPDFVAKHKLKIETTPKGHTEIVMPLKNNTFGNKDIMSFEMITRWSNMKFTLSGSGKGVTLYQDFGLFPVIKFC